MNPNDYYTDFKTGLNLSDKGCLFISLYKDRNTPNIIIKKLRNDLNDFFNFPIYLNDDRMCNLNFIPSST